MNVFDYAVDLDYCHGCSKCKEERYNPGDFPDHWGMMTSFECEAEDEKDCPAYDDYHDGLEESRHEQNKKDL
jgi:hypothetical protein